MSGWGAGGLGLDRSSWVPAFAHSKPGLLSPRDPGPSQRIRGTGGGWAGDTVGGGGTPGGPGRGGEAALTGGWLEAPAQRSGAWGCVHPAPSGPLPPGSGFPALCSQAFSAAGLYNVSYV